MPHAISSILLAVWRWLGGYSGASNFGVLCVSLVCVLLVLLLWRALRPPQPEAPAETFAALANHFMSQAAVADKRRPATRIIPQPSPRDRALAAQLSAQFLAAHHPTGAGGPRSPAPRPAAEPEWDGDRANHPTIHCNRFD